MLASDHGFFLYRSLDEFDIWSNGVAFLITDSCRLPHGVFVREADALKATLGLFYLKVAKKDAGPLRSYTKTDLWR